MAGITTLYGVDATKCPPQIGKVLEAFPCPYKYGNIRRILFMSQSSDFPFTSLALLQSEATWTALLALDIADYPDNALFSPNITEFAKPAVEPTITTSNNGSVSNGGFPPSVITYGLQHSSPTDENQIKQTVEKNEKSMGVLFITDENQIIYRCTSNLLGTVPELIPVNLATFGSKSIEGGVQTNLGQLHIDHAKEFGWWATNVSWNILAKKAA